MNYNAFRELVKTMRAAQRKYERARLVSCGLTLEEAEAAKDEAEADVDSWLKAYEQKGNGR